MRVLHRMIDEWSGKFNSFRYPVAPLPGLNKRMQPLDPSLVMTQRRLTEIFEILFGKFLGTILYDEPARSTANITFLTFIFISPATIMSRAKAQAAPRFAPRR